MMTTQMIANRYEHVGSLNERGGMGEVDIFTDLHLRRDVVIKRLQAGVEEKRLLDEQKSLAKLRSKHVVQLYDIVAIGDMPEAEAALVLEYIDGKPIEVNSYHVGEELLKCLWQISCGLAEIHAAKIIHRDIKPQNLKVDSEGVVKILDFGLARGDDEAVTRSIIGTPVYMAPELWGEQTISFDASIDAYAFAITSLALVTDNPPRELCVSPPLTISYETFRGYLDKFHEEIVNILFQCLSHNPSARPSMRAVSDTLKKHLLFNKHKATVVLDGSVHVLNEQNRKTRLSANVGMLEIEYDGLNFKVKSANGHVLINNKQVTAGDIVPGCSVIAFGRPDKVRKFVTFDVSNPEVMP